MPTLICPDCGTDRELERVERSASCFCEECDYPLFWMPAVQLSESVAESGEEALRRLPGAGGRLQVVDLVCPACGERNPLGARNCLRCEASLLPAPPPPPDPPAPAPVVVAPPAPPPAPEPPNRFWWWVALAVGLALVTILVLWLA